MFNFHVRTIMSLNAMNNANAARMSITSRRRDEDIDDENWNDNTDEEKFTNDEEENK